MLNLHGQTKLRGLNFMKILLHEGVKLYEEIFSQRVTFARGDIFAQPENFQRNEFFV